MKYQCNIYLRKLLSWGLNAVCGLCAILLLLLLMQLLFFTSFKIPSDSMEPALLTGDYILVDKCSGGARLFDIFAALEKKDVKIYRMPRGGGISRGMMCWCSTSLIRRGGIALLLM